jgi:membrane glycosyltransferase
VFAQGIMAYIASPIWLLFLVTSLASPFFAPRPDYFPEPHFPFPIFPADETMMAVVLVVFIWCLLILPKFIIVVRGVFTGDNRGFGGTLHALVSTFCEIIFSSLVAPLMLWFQSRAVVQVLLGADGGWSAANRGGGRMSLSDAWAASRSIVLTGALASTFTIMFAPDLFWWLLPIAIPMLIAPLLIWGTSQNAERGLAGYLFRTPAEVEPAAVMKSRDEIFAAWQQTTPEAVLLDLMTADNELDAPPSPVAAEA